MGTRTDPAGITTRQLIEHMGESVLLTDAHGRIRMVNGAFSRVTGYRPEEVLGKNPRLLQSGRHGPAFYKALWGAVRAEGWWEGEIWNRRKDGTLYPEWLRISAVHDGRGRVFRYLGVFTDITGRKLSEEKLFRLAHHDPLTGLPNRLLFRDRLGQAIAQARRQGVKVAVLFLDLDGFKPFNDLYGHLFGDHVLFQAARRMARALRRSDTLAQVGGDEFAALLFGVTPGGAGRTARALIRSLDKPFTVDRRPVKLGLSAGIALYPDDNLDGDNLLRLADAAMYRAKAAGGGCALAADGRTP
jgi:diguanylate cyclase (GGDEF)-like protein/PAS domain S-box-containing protein